MLKTNASWDLPRGLLAYICFSCGRDISLVSLKTFSLLLGEKNVCFGLKLEIVLWILYILGLFSADITSPWCMFLGVFISDLIIFSDITRVLFEMQFGKMWDKIYPFEPFCYENRFSLNLNGSQSITVWLKR